MTKLFKSKYCFVYLVLFSGVLFFSSIGFRDLLRPDEPRVAGISAEMSRTGSYLAPRLNGEFFLEQPPLYYWVSSGIMSVFGNNSFSARLFPALSGFLGTLLIYLLARKSGLDRLYSFLAGVAVASSAEYWVIANRTLTDMPLCFFIVLSMFSFYNLHSIYRKQESNGMFILWYPLFVLSLSGAILTKSLIGLGIPSCALFFWLVSECYFDRRPYGESWYALFSGALLSLIPLAAWVTKLYSVYGYEPAYTVVWYNNFGRFSGDHPDHAEPFYYYAEYVFTHLMPWTILLATSIWYCVKNKTVFRDDSTLRFILCWLIFPFLALCVAKGKRPVYLLPLIPAGAFFASVYSMKLAQTVKRLSGVNWNRIIGILAVLLLIGYSIGAVAITVNGNRNLSYKSLFKYCKKTIPPESNLYLYRPSEAVCGGVEFYLGRTCRVLTNIDSVMRVLENKKSYMIAQDGDGIRPEWIMKKFKVKGDNWCVLHSGEAVKGK